MSASLWAVQDALHDALLADAGIQALLGTPARVYDHVPPNPVFPYVTLGEASARPFDTKDRNGLDQTVTLAVWSRYRGRKQVKDILAAIYNVFHNGTITVTGIDFVLCRLESVSITQDGDGLTYRGFARYRIVTQG